MRESWNILKRDPELLLFPIFSSICSIVVLASFAIPIFSSNLLSQNTVHDPNGRIIGFVLTFLFYLVTYFFITFFNAALITCVASRLSGGGASISYGMNEAFKRVHLIFAWALVAATVGTILRLIEERSKLVGRIVAGLLGIAWSMGSFLAVPVLVLEGMGPFAAVVESTKLLKKTWGERVAGRISFGLISLLLYLPAFALIAGGIYLYAAFNNQALAIIVGGLGIFCLACVAILTATLESIFRSALYLYAKGGTAEPGSYGFPVELLQSAVISKS